MFEFPAQGQKHIGAIVAIVALGGTLGGYAIHEHSMARNLAAKNQQSTTALHDTQHELLDLTTKVNMLVARDQAQAQAAAAAQTAQASHPARARVRREDPRYKKLQSQLDAQGKAIDQTRTELEGDLASTRTELTGSIAHTHDELVLLEKRGERNYAEFDLVKSKQFEHKGPFGVRLRKANVKHQFADMDLIVDDRDLTQKHINLYQPVMFSTPDSPQPVEMVINAISKNHIHGYISAPKYRQSELASMSNAPDSAAQGQDQAPVSSTPQLVTRKSPQ